jgi:hypothetical protein
VRAAFFAAADRAALDRFRALVRACRDNARPDAAALPSLRNARRTAVERFLETLRFVPRAPFAASRAACFRVVADAVPFFGGGSFTPARRAFDNPIAIACFVDRAPCFPSRT